MLATFRGFGAVQGKHLHTASLSLTGHGHSLQSMSVDDSMQEAWASFPWCLRNWTSKVPVICVKDMLYLVLP